MKRYFYLLIVLTIGLYSCEKDILEPIDETSIVDVTIEDTSDFNPIEFETVDPFLSTPASGSMKTVNVVVINYIPTKDQGKTLDQTTFPFAGDNGVDMNLPVSEYKKWLLSTTVRVKHGVEQSTRFRGYKNSNDPYIGIRVLEYINVYEMPKIERSMSASLFAQDSTEGYYPDYHKLFEMIKLDSLVNNHDVKEVWFNRKSLAVPESNMSSPVSGDVSNPYYGSSQYGFTNQIIPDDLPIYDKTYVVYSHWMHNSYEKILHVRGHQMEVQLDKLEGPLFLWGKFKGFTYTSNGRERGCGTTHFPVNAGGSYQYNNTNTIMSDIEDWKPDNTGQQSLINKDNWVRNYTINYNFPTSSYKSEVSRNTIGNDGEGGWMIYWFQSFPGHNNGLEFEGHTLRNWWDLLYEWDYYYQYDKKLYN